MSQQVKRACDSPMSSPKHKAVKSSSGNQQFAQMNPLDSLQHLSVEDKWYISAAEMRNFLSLIENDERIKYFLNFDFCCRIADKYLLAMVFAYFKRANLRSYQINRRNFFVALYLAHDMEEEDDSFKVDLVKWALGPSWKFRLSRFLIERQRLWSQMQFRAIVSRKLCLEIMSVCSEHFVWKRERRALHAGAYRVYPHSYSADQHSCTTCLPPQSQENNEQNTCEE